MDIQALLQGVDCPCGRHHTCAIRAVRIGRDAIAQLTGLTERHRAVLLVADENTYAAAGAQTASALGERLAGQVIFPGAPLLIPNEQAVDTVTAALKGAGAIVGVGSGVIQDLCKYVAHTQGLPYYIVATAPSMDGYASTGAAMILGGMKVTASCGVPEAILADTQVLKNAPMDMIRSGYGDIVGKYSALNDWRLSHAVTGEYFCQAIYDLTFEMLTKTLALAGGLAARDEESVGVLMEALVAVGIAMSFAGSSRPASGSEHHLSHYFEITGILRGVPYFPHGIDVGYATVLTAKLRQALLESPWPETQYRPDKQAQEREMRRIYGPIAESCAALQEKAGFYQRDLVSVYKENEPELRRILADMPSPTEIEAMLAAVGLDMAPFYSQYRPEALADAVRYAKDLKDRYTVLWMHFHLLGGAGCG